MFLLHVVFQCSQYYFLKRLSFLHCIYLAPWLLINWPHSMVLFLGCLFFSIYVYVFVPVPYTFFFPFLPHGFWDFSSPTRDWTQHTLLTTVALWYGLKSGSMMLQFCSSFFRLFYLGLLGPTQILELFFPILWKMPWIFWLR